MTAEQVFDTYIKNYISIGYTRPEIITAMKEFARLMCDEQKEICYSNIRILRGDWYDQGDKLGEPYLDEDKFLKAPYPDGLLHMWVLADLRQFTPYYFWKVSNVGTLMCTGIKDTPKFDSKKEAQYYLDSLPEDSSFEFKPYELIIKR